MENGNNKWERFVKLIWTVMGLMINKNREVETVNGLLQFAVEEREPEDLLNHHLAATSVHTAPRFGWVTELQKFYWEVFGMKVDFSHVTIPDDPGGFGWVVIVAMGLTINRVWGVYKHLFNVCVEDRWGLSDDFDKVIVFNERTPSDGSYARRFRDRVEADKENACLLPSQLPSGGENITLLERLLLGLWYWWRTGKQLDNKEGRDACIETLCAGSKYVGYDSPNQSGGSYSHYNSQTPVVCFSNGKVYVLTRHPVDDGKLCRSRTAIPPTQAA